MPSSPRFARRRPRAVTEIREKEAERKTETNGTEKDIILKSIEILNEALKDLRATRAKLIDASIAAPVPVPVPGKSTPLYEICALCCRLHLLVCIGD